MTGPDLKPARIRTALAARLRAVARVLLATPAPSFVPDPDRDGAALLDVLVHDVHTDPSPARVWLLYVAITGCYPDSDTVADALRQFELQDALDCAMWLLDAAVKRDVDPVGRELQLISGGVVVDVDHTAREDLHTGIQQVARQTMPIWNARHDIVLAAWTPDLTALRILDESEVARVVAWPKASSRQSGAPLRQVRKASDEPSPIVVAWNGVLVLVEVATPNPASRLAALARHSNNAVTLVGYDCVPVVSADLVPPAEATKFVRYLEVVKHAKRVAAISASAAVEFQGFIDTLSAQGLSGPTVVECVLASDEARMVHHSAPDQHDRPTVLMVGSFEPRKNHLGVLHAAEVLWREGLDFELQLIGGSGWGEEIPARISELKASGRPLTVRHRVSREVIEDAYLDARFTVFPSLHEGYGLPIAESLAAGTPVIASNFGSMSELATLGGALMVDPHNDAALIDAMRTLLLEDDTLRTLATQIARHPKRRWDEYAEQLWDVLVATELPGSGRRVR